LKEPVVLDATCLIGLERIEQVGLLIELFEPILIPPAVAREFANSIDEIQTEELIDRSLASVLELVVGPGESEAIALAKEKDYRVVTDDKQARAAARSAGVKVIGTVGVLLRAKSAGLITHIRPLMDELDETGFRIGPSLRNEALRLANE